jgi:hypothetical protein
VAEVLVVHALDHVRVGQEDECGLELGSALREQQLVEVGQRDDEPDVVDADELGE